MTSCRRYQFIFETDHGHLQIEQLVADHFKDTPWLADVQVSGVGSLSFTMTVSGRDQWFVHKRAMMVASAAAWQLDVQVPVPLWDVLPPHTNRGYARYRR